MKFHLKDNGDPGICTARLGHCPKSPSAPHFTSEESSRKFYEIVMKQATSKTPEERKEGLLKEQKFWQEKINEEKENPNSDGEEIVEYYKNSLESINTRIHNEGFDKTPEEKVVNKKIQEITSIARRATAHNYGNTVLESKYNSDGSFSILLSSWPRANEAIRAFNQQGFNADFGENNKGQWIIVKENS